MGPLTHGAALRLEVALAGKPGLESMHSKTVFGLSDIKVLFNYGVEYKEARQETINRLQSTPSLPSGVTPQISPNSPTGEIFRYVLRAPKDVSGRNLYAFNDLKALQDWVLEREFRAIPRVVDVTSWGGTIRRYEVQPDPDRMRRWSLGNGSQTTHSPLRPEFCIMVFVPQSRPNRMNLLGL